ncbi:serpin family protein [Pedobacter psychroterrae]|uniref:Serpin family protein n=1 Tax=Pedobacter psychroterrae TaxID=2530453 RepID=A0A4R0NML4_9SPHI|nr:serpin family protein [Pedobacter psychroterrae]TCD01459.1 serpin family protein [Pedobacter psychroterrae]
MKKYLILFVPVILLVLSCKKNQEKENGYTGKSLVLTAKEQQKADKDNEFTFKLLKEVAADLPGSKNMMLSPLSVSMAVGMTSNGANGQTLEAIRNTMQFSDFTEAEVNAYYQKIITELPELDPKAILNVANSIWYRNGFEVLPAFLKTNSDHYKAEVQGLDFASPGAKDQINNWVSTNTNGKIPTIIDQIRGDMVMFLINAVYFKSNWSSKFDKNKTAKGDFHLTVQNKVQADFMTAMLKINSFINAEASVIELPYGNKRYSMVIAMPTGATTAGTLAETLTTQKWNQWMSGLREGQNDIRVPKFKFEYEIKLNDPLTALGMGNAFSDMADFTRLRSNGNLKIDEVKHKTFIEVNEEGTEAAAATSVGIVETSAPAPIMINRPFIFAIREMKTGLILFTGIVNNPLLDK